MFVDLILKLLSSVGTCCIFQATRKDPRQGPTLLVLAPTRELAVQIKIEADKFGRSSGIKNT